MKPKDLSFGVPCEPCVQELGEALPRCGGLDYTFLRENERLQAVTGTCWSHEGEISFYLCRSCGCRWRIFDWVQCCCVVVSQESTDGAYYSDGAYVDGKKHGRHIYSRLGAGDPWVLCEIWDHGRLVERKEYGPFAADGSGFQPVIRTWRAPKRSARRKAMRLLDSAHSSSEHP